MEDMKTMEICECGNIIYMVKEHSPHEGKRLKAILEEIIVTQAVKDMTK